MIKISSYSPLRTQQGMALIYVMLIIVLVSSIFVATTWRFELGMSRNENRWHGLQGRLVLEGGEELVGKILLTEDFNDTVPDGEADHLREAWNDPISMPIDGGSISAQIEDAQGRFNINLLSVLPPQRNEEKQQECEQSQSFDCRFTVAQRRFIRFLQVIPMNDGPMEPAEAEAITEAIIDWMDGDSNPRGFGGAEQSYYSGGEVPIVVPNTPMTSISELSLVKGIREQPDLYERLLPYVIALPAGGDAARVAHININTMPDIMFRMFNEKENNLPLDAEFGADLARIRQESLVEPNQGYQNTQDFIDAFVTDVQAVNRAEDFDSTQLVISTNYFIYSAEAIMGDKMRRSKALILRIKGQKPQTLWRTDANF